MVRLRSESDLNLGYSETHGRYFEDGFFGDFGLLVETLPGSGFGFGFSLGCAPFAISYLLKIE
jgi:hypothetical protein